MSVIADLLVRVSADVSGLTSGLSTASQTVQNAGAGMMKVGGALSVGVSAPLLAIGKSALTSAMDFESGMNRVLALSGATEVEFSSLKETAMELGATTRYSATEAADAMGFLAMAGFDANSIIGAMPSTLQLAAAAQLDLARAADITSNIMTGYGMTVDDLARVNDVLVTSFTNANTDLSQLGEAMKYAGPVASALGMDFEEAAAAISMMGNAGIQGSMAGTSLRNALSRLAAPTKAQADLMADLGMNVFDSSGKIISLADIMDQLSDSGASAANIMDLFGMRAGPAMLALLEQGSGELRNFTAMLEDSGGTAERVASVQMAGMKGALTELKSAWEGVQIAFMDMGGLAMVENLIKSVTQAVRDGFAAWQELDAPVRNAIVAIGGVLALSGPLLLGLGAITFALGALLSPVGLVVVGIAALAAAFATGAIDMDSIRPVIDAVGSAFEWLRGVAETVLAGIQQFWQEHGAAIQASAEATWNAIVSVVSTVVEAISAVVQAVLGAVGTFIANHGADILSFMVTAWSAIQEIIQTALAIIQAVVVPILTGIADFIRDHGETIQQILSVAWNAITTVITVVLTAIQGVLKAVLQILQGDWEGAWTTMKSTAESIWNTIQAFLTNNWETIRAIAETIWTGILDFLRTTLDNMVIAVRVFVGQMFDAGAALIRGLMDGIRSMAQSLIDAVTGTVQNAIDRAKALLGISSPSRVFRSIGEQTVAGLIEGLTSGYGDVDRAMQGLLQRPQAATARLALAGAVGRPGIGAPGGNGQAVTINIYNPKGEPSEDSIRREMRYLASGMWAVS